MTDEFAERVNQSINESVNQSVSQSVSQSVNQVCPVFYPRWRVASSQHQTVNRDVRPSFSLGT